MFECHHHGQCCEDPVTQINLTLGDLQRLTTSTQKSTLQLYKDKIIGIQPFGDPENNIGVSYVMNQMKNNFAADGRSLELINATYKCLNKE